mgnify:CR=1 FL=1
MQEPSIVMFISESEALRAVFSEDTRPSLKSFQRYRRKLGLPAYHFGRRVIYNLEELEDAIKKMKHPKPD